MAKKEDKEKAPADKGKRGKPATQEEMRFDWSVKK